VWVDEEDTPEILGIYTTPRKAVNGAFRVGPSRIGATKAEVLRFVEVNDMLEMLFGKSEADALLVTIDTATLDQTVWR
jgi:hypothetical protein